MDRNPINLTHNRLGLIERWIGKSELIGHIRIETRLIGPVYRVIILDLTFAPTLKCRVIILDLTFALHSQV